MTKSEEESITKNTKRAEHNTVRNGVRITKRNCARSMHVRCAEVATQSERRHNIAQLRSINMQWQVKVCN
jgi:hypothetical protein